MNASQRMIKQLKRRINYYQLYQNFTNWRPEDFGKVDRIVEEQKRFEIERYGYYQSFNKKDAH